MTELKPFLSWYGSKWKAAGRYPAPTHDTIVEPFAGGAGYALRHSEKRVILIERDPRVAAIWRYLIAASPADILALPLLGLEQTIDELPECHPAGLELIRAWLQGASRNGKNRFSSMAKKAFAANPNTPAFWGAACRARIASQVEQIKHWTLIEGDYSSAPDVEATWFVDPPYNNAAGRVYRFHELDYARLGEWCRSRSGQVVVCENEGADWLPFAPLYETKQAWNTDETKSAVEVVYLQDTKPEPAPISGVQLVEPKQAPIAGAQQVILCGDAAALMSFDEIALCDVMLTDPEYSRHTHASAVSCSAVKGATKREFGFEHMTPASRRWLARAAASVKRWSVLYSDVEGSTWLRISCEAAGAEYVRTMPWVRWSMPQLSGDRPSQSFEHLLLFHRQHAGPRGGRKPVAKHWNGPGSFTDFRQKCLRGEDKHKAEKPLDQALDLVAWFSDPGELVFDPRAGRGTLGVACRLLGRNYLGIERNPVEAGKALARLAAPLSERDAERAARWANETLERVDRENATAYPTRLLDADFAVARSIRFA